MGVFLTAEDAEGRGGNAEVSSSIPFAASESVMIQESGDMGMKGDTGERSADRVSPPISLRPHISLYCFAAYGRVSGD